MQDQNSYRLPKIAKPLSYQLSIKPNFESFDFEGNVQIIIKILQDSDHITLHSKNLTIKHVYITDEDIFPLVVTEEQPISEKSMFSIYTQEHFTKDKIYELNMSFDGSLAEESKGFYKTSYKNAEGQERWIAATQFEPTHARKAFPCFDEPEYKATFKITIITPYGYHALSNMPFQTIMETSLTPKVFYYEFEESKEMSTYLVAFIVSDFTSISSIGTKYDFSTWSRPAVITSADFSLEIGNNLLVTLETYTGIEYQLPKIDQVAIPHYTPAMENWGLITYREEALLYYHGISTEIDKKGILLIIAHELSHMWFGNLVTLQWWSDTWLNEGFARYFQYIAANAVLPEWRLMDQFVVDLQQNMLNKDSKLDVLPLFSECSTPEQIMEKFDLSTYNKGASVLRMLTHILTPKTFQRGIRRYLSENQWSNTTRADLYDALEIQRLEDNIGMHSVSTIFEQWITQPGYPVLNVQRNGNNITISQERFLVLEHEKAVEALKWWVPLTWTVNGNAPNGFNDTEPQEWITPFEEIKSINIEVKDNEWIIFNNQATGFYRINYDKESWNLIIRGLMRNHRDIHVVNRSQILDDALNLARAGKLKYSTALEVSFYLQEETDYIPWASGFAALSYLNSRFLSFPEYDLFKNYTLFLLESIYQKLGFEENYRDNHLTKLHRIDVLTWICKLGHKDAIKKAQELFNKFCSKPSHYPIPANFRKVVYCTVIEHGGDEEWHFIWNLYKQSTTNKEKEIILSALGCTRNTKLLNNYLKKIQENPGVMKIHQGNIFASVCNNPIGFQIAFTFLQDYMKYKKDLERTRLFLGHLIHKVSLETHADELHTFITANSDYLGEITEKAFTALENSKKQLLWTRTYKDEIISWIKDKNDVISNIQSSSNPKR